MELLDLGKKPISGSKPAGEDVSFEAEFEALQNEIEKLSSPTASSGVDWNKVSKLSIIILCEKSKNLLVGAYLCIALLKTRGFDGFEKGIRILADLIEHFWDNMYPPPKRMKGRRNAIAWLIVKIQETIAEREPEKWPKERRDSLMDDLDAIDVFLGDHMDDAPMMRIIGASSI